MERTVETERYRRVFEIDRPISLFFWDLREYANGWGLFGKSDPSKRRFYCDYPCDAGARPDWIRLLIAPRHRQRIGQLQLLRAMDIRSECNLAERSRSSSHRRHQPPPLLRRRRLRELALDR